MSARGAAMQGHKSGNKTPLVAHVVFALDIGGLENGLVNLINRTPSHAVRHAIICITAATSFRERLRSDDIEVIELRKKPGNELGVYWRFWKALRKLQPDIVHTRNASALEFQFVSFLAGVKIRLHGEHGWDVHDIDGTSRKYQWLRRLMKPFITRFVVVSEDLKRYLMFAVSVPEQHIVLIRNGVDTEKFYPRDNRDTVDEATGRSTVVVTVGRLKDVKNHRLLITAFAEVLERRRRDTGSLRLVIIGDGPLREELETQIGEFRIDDAVLMCGATDNVSNFLRNADLFVSASRNEGISNTILEAMATGLPVVATAVGGTPEIVAHEVTGILVESGNVDSMAKAIERYIRDPALRLRHGAAARRTAESEFALSAMVNRYLELYSACAENA